jgi:hypothetical protein
MPKPKKDSTLFPGELDDKLCLNCGFPNRKSDRHCMYCKSSLLVEEGLVPWIRETYYILRWRWQLKQGRHRIDSPSESYLPTLKLLGYCIIGLTLSTLGLYLFSEALADSSFSSGLIASLFLYYGVLTLKSVFIKK